MHSIQTDPSLLYQATDYIKLLLHYCTDDGLQLEGSRFIQATRLHLEKPTVKVDEDVSMVIHLHSRFPQPLTCDTVQLALSPCICEQLEQVVAFPLPTVSVCVGVFVCV